MCQLIDPRNILCGNSPVGRDAEIRVLNIQEAFVAFQGYTVRHLHGARQILYMMLLYIASYGEPVVYH